MDCSFDDKVLERKFVELGEGFGLSHGSHVVEAEPETKLFQLFRLVLDGGGVQHGYIFNSDALPDQALASANRNIPLVDVPHKTKLF